MKWIRNVYSRHGDDKPAYFFGSGAV
jgi:hypothetical protein